MMGFAKKMSRSEFVRRGSKKIKVGMALKGIGRTWNRIKGNQKIVPLAKNKRI